VITREDAERLRDQLLRLLDEDAHNTERLLRRLDSLTRETGIGAHGALLLILTHLTFEEEAARREWEAILAHRDDLSRRLGRDVGVRVALLDHFLNVNRRLVEPTLVDLELAACGGEDEGIDPRTGLIDDRRFRGVLQRELRRARRYGERAALVVVDLDRFRDTNERFGELVGDRLLREVAILLSNNVRDIDVAARTGEDEFVLLLPATDRNGGLLVAERFRREAESYFAGRESGGRPIELTVSAGVACFPDDAASPEAVLEHAAQALYQAKAGGRNAVAVYAPERRRYLRFELEPGRFEVEVLAPSERAIGEGRNLSRNGILFSSPEPLLVGEEIEIRLADAGPAPAGRTLRVRGRVVRLEELPEPAADVEAGDRFEVGVALALEWDEGTDDLLEFLERAQGHRSRHQP
jgi:diguanylate cyclase (GGDEF)-like protein